MMDLLDLARTEQCQLSEAWEEDRRDPPSVARRSSQTSCPAHLLPYSSYSAYISFDPPC